MMARTITSVHKAEKRQTPKIHTHLTSPFAGATTLRAIVTAKRLVRKDRSGIRVLRLYRRLPGFLKKPFNRHLAWRS